MKTVHIASCFDRAFAVPAAVLATSILAHAHPDRRYVFHVLYDGEDDFGPRLFEIFEGTRLEIDVQRVTNPFSGVPTSRANLSPAVYVRLGLPEFLPGIGKVVYLDADTLCLEDVGALFDTDLGDAPIAASLDPPMVNLVAYERQRGRGPSPRSATRYLKHELGLGDAMTRYFNSGVLVRRPEDPQGPELGPVEPQRKTAAEQLDLLPLRAHVVDLCRPPAAPPSWRAGFKSVWSARIRPDPCPRSASCSSVPRICSRSPANTAAASSGSSAGASLSPASAGACAPG
jgi:hypothetical protein